MLPSPPPEQTLATGAIPVDDDPARRRRGRLTWLSIVGAVLIAAALAAYFIRLPYYTISPGSAIDVNDRVEVDGAATYDADGELLLLFVRQRARVNVWRWLQASFDPDIDLFREEEFTGGQSPEEVRTAAEAEMALSQLAAKKVALEAAGYEVPVSGNGVVVLGVLPSRPAADVIEPGDVILAVEDRPIVESSDLSRIIREYEIGDEVTVRFERGGKEQTSLVGIEADDSGTPVIGVYVAARYDFPVEVELDTSSIGGPSAGLAMTLSIIDLLTPGELTGGLTVAITGTIAADGSVGEIGGLSQKTVAARAADASLFIVPACTDEAILEGCRDDLARAQDRAGDLEIVPVASLDEALRALESAGGDPLQLAG